MGSEGAKAAQDKAQRLLLENGVTFVAQGERDRSRPWRLDLFPMLLGPDEWSGIERAVIQRTRLLNDLLADLYGAQRVLKHKVLPPGIVYGNPQFLRPCTSVPVRDNLHLHFVAYDLARAADLLGHLFPEWDPGAEPVAEEAGELKIGERSSDGP